MKQFRHIYIGSDHAGVSLRLAIEAHATAQGYDLTDCGTFGEDSVSYVAYAVKVCSHIKDAPEACGILVCGSGIGISMAANRYPYVRAANCLDTQMAALARGHNDANVLALGARLIETDAALACVDTFLSTPFEGGRHLERVEQLSSPCY